MLYINFDRLTIDRDDFSCSKWVSMCNGRQALLYVIIAIDGGECFIKVGRTSKKMKERFSKFSYNWELLFAKYGTPQYIFNLENKLHHELRGSGYGYTPLREFSGMSECYVTESLSIISSVLRTPIRADIKNICKKA